MHPPSTAHPPRLRITDIALAERPVAFRTPFRFGAVTVDAASQLFIHVEIELEGKGRARGAAAELMVPKWFNKDPQLSADETVEQLRRSVAIARRLYLAERSFDTAFGTHAARIESQLADCARLGIPALAACFGPAEIDKAVLDALLRRLGTDVFTGLRTNVVGLDARLTPDLDPDTIARYLSGRRPAERVAIRHTVGMLDPLDSIHEAVRVCGCRYFKLKLSGDPEQDRARLADIATALAAVDYRVTLDANEQYANPARLGELVEALRSDARLAILAGRLLYIEQPLPRELTWDHALGAAGEAFAFIIDEADDGYDAFPRARALGYRGVSSKSCKGLYKSLLNGARAMRWNEAGESCFLAAEDLTCQAGLAVQQDTALATFLGITHIERNGHHYVDGFAGTPEAEAEAFLAAHPDLYERSDGQIRLAIRGGEISARSLACAGFASAVSPDRVGPGSTSTATSSIKEYST